MTWTSVTRGAFPTETIKIYDLKKIIIIQYGVLHKFSLNTSWLMQWKPWHLAVNIERHYVDIISEISIPIIDRKLVQWPLEARNVELPTTYSKKSPAQIIYTVISIGICVGGIL